MKRYAFMDSLRKFVETVIPYSAKFSRDNIFTDRPLSLSLQIFAEINFSDQGFPLATPSTIYSQSQQRHARLLASRFWLNFV